MYEGPLHLALTHLPLGVGSVLLLVAAWLMVRSCRPQLTADAAKTHRKGRRAEPLRD